MSALSLTMMIIGNLYNLPGANVIPLRALLQFANVTVCSVLPICDSLCCLPL